MYRKSWSDKSLIWSYLNLGLSFRVKRGWPNFAFFSLINCPSHLGYDISLKKIIGWESFDVVM